MSLDHVIQYLTNIDKWRFITHSTETGQLLAKYVSLECAVSDYFFRCLYSGTDIDSAQWFKGNTNVITLLINKWLIQAIRKFIWSEHFVWVILPSSHMVLYQALACLTGVYVLAYARTRVSTHARALTCIWAYHSRALVILLKWFI